MSDQQQPPPDGEQSGFFTKVKNPVSRPKLLTGLCGLWIFYLAWVMRFTWAQKDAMLSEVVAGVPNFIPVSMATLTAQIIGLIGVWFMRRWGASLYTLGVMVNLGFLWSNGMFAPSHVVYLINTVLVMAHFKRMI